jgi:hypothetical protein
MNQLFNPLLTEVTKELASLRSDLAEVRPHAQTAPNHGAGVGQAATQEAAEPAGQLGGSTELFARI